MSAFLAMLAVALLLAAVDRTERAHITHDQRAMVLERLSLVRVRLESHLNQVIASARSLALVYGTRPEFSESEFNTMARVAAQDQTSLVNIGLIRDTVLRQVYPLAGNEKAIGLDIRKTPTMWPAFQRMMASRSIIIAGPVALVQGGTGLIVRIPVYRSVTVGASGIGADNGDFLGAISIPLDADKVFEDAGLPELEREFVVALRGRDATGAGGDVFRGDGLTFGRALAQQDIVLPGGSWQIAAYPRDDALPASVLRLRAVGLVMCLLSGLLAYNLTRQAQRRAESDERLQTANQRLQTVLATVPDLMFEMDLQGRYLDVWPGRDPDLLVVERERLLGRTVRELMPAAQAETVLETLAEAHRDGSSRGRRITLDLPTGRHHFEMSAARGPDDGGARFVVLSRDVTRQVRAEHELRIAATAFESQDGIMIVDAQHRIVRVNQSFTEITGYSAEEAVGQKPSMLRSGRHDAAFYAEMNARLAATGRWSGEIWNRRKDGEVFPEWLTITAVPGPRGDALQYIGSFIDVTQRKRVEQEIERLAFHDPLTGLPNRRLLTDRLHHALSDCGRNHCRAALLFIDLDNFKTLNDTRGHDVGDLLLVEVARRLGGIVREIDTVARLGGDEFVVLIENLDPQADAAAAAARLVGQKIGDAVAQPHALRDEIHITTCSVGIRVFEHGARVEDLLKHADTAMYAAKTAGRNTVRFFDPAMEEALQRRTQTEVGLRLALQRGEFALHAQIQVDTQDRPIGAELLLRWHHPERGLVTPAEFIGLAEDVGLIVPIGRWVLERAAAQLKAWQGRPVLGRLTLAVNVSARQLHEPGFADMVRQIVSEHGIDPALLKLEITESAVLNDVDQVVALMQSLGLSGVRFSMDDFGTGYSSLQYLKRLPLSQLKIDRSFVRDLASDHHDQAIVRTIIAMAHTMNLDVIAEGVETGLQRNLLTAAGCSRFQGYLIGRPVPIDEFEARVEQLGRPVATA